MRPRCLPVAAAAVSALLGTSAESPQVDSVVQPADDKHWSEWTLHSGRNCYQWNGAGDDIHGKSPLPDLHTLEECKSACAAEPACEGLVRRNGADSGKCWLRKEIRMSHCAFDSYYETWTYDRKKQEESSCSADYTKFPTENCWIGAGCVGIFGYDPVPGVDNMEACRAMCTVTPTCEAFVMRHDGTGCWLKSNVDPYNLQHGDDGRDVYDIWLSHKVVSVGKLKNGDIISISTVQPSHDVIIRKVVVGFCHTESGASVFGMSSDGRSVEVRVWWGYGCGKDESHLGFASKFTIPAADNKTEFACHTPEGLELASQKCVARVLPDEPLEVAICPQTPTGQSLWRRVEVGACTDHNGFSALAEQRQHGRISVKTSYGHGCALGNGCHWAADVPESGVCPPLAEWDMIVDGVTQIPCPLVDPSEGASGVQCTAHVGICPESVSPAPAPGRTINICPVEELYAEIHRKVVENECTLHAGGANLGVPHGEAVEVRLHWATWVSEPEDSCVSGMPLGTFWIPAVDGHSKFPCYSVEGTPYGKCVATLDDCPTPPEPKAPSRILITPVNMNDIPSRKAMLYEVWTHTCHSTGWSGSSYAEEDGDKVKVLLFDNWCWNYGKPHHFDDIAGNSDHAFTIPAVDGKTTFKCMQMDGTASSADCVAKKHTDADDVHITTMGDPKGTVVSVVVVGGCYDFAGGSTFAKEGAPGSIDFVQYWGSGCMAGASVYSATIPKLDGATQFDCWTVEGDVDVKCTGKAGEAPAAPPAMGGGGPAAPAAPAAPAPDAAPDAAATPVTDAKADGGRCCAEELEGDLFKKCDFWGDLHFTASFGVGRFDHQGLGAYRISISQEGDFEVQDFQCPWLSQEVPKVAVGVGVRVGATRIVVIQDKVYVNGNEESSLPWLSDGVSVTGTLADGLVVQGADCCSRASIRTVHNGDDPGFWHNVRVRMPDPQADGICGKGPTYNEALSKDDAIFDEKLMAEMCGFCTVKPAQCDGDFSAPAPLPAPETPDDACAAAEREGKCEAPAKAKASEACSELEGTDFFDGCVVDFCRTKCDPAIVAEIVREKEKSQAQLASAVVESDWQLFEGYNCFEGHGAEHIAVVDLVGLKKKTECEALCANEPKCEGFVMKSLADPENCHMRTSIVPNECKQDTEFNLYLKPKSGDVVAKFSQGPSRRMSGHRDSHSGLGFVAAIAAVCAVGYAVLSLAWRGSGSYSTSRRDAIVRVDSEEGGPMDERMPLTAGYQGTPRGSGNFL